MQQLVSLLTNLKSILWVWFFQIHYDSATTNEPAAEPAFFAEMEQSPVQHGQRI
jgi:hypothetical protein